MVTFAADAEDEKPIVGATRKKVTRPAAVGKLAEKLGFPSCKVSTCFWMLEGV